ncbi:MAG: DUF2892 domain-containing protein [Rhodospirillaceae bacterium]
MTKNVGGIDRVLRIIVGLGVLSLLFVLDGSQRWLGLIGLVPLLTAAISFCPLYPLVGFNTCGRCSSSKEQ